MIVISKDEFLLEWKKLMGENPLHDSIFNKQWGKIDEEENQSIEAIKNFTRNLCEAARAFNDEKLINDCRKKMNQLIYEYNLTLNIKKETDIVISRNTGREVARFIGFGKTDQIKIATAISELARNIVYYADQGEIKISIIHDFRDGIKIISEDQGKGIDDLDEVMSDDYVSNRGMGTGLKSVKRLVDEFDIQTKVGKGTRVEITKFNR